MDVYERVESKREFACCLLGRFLCLFVLFCLFLV